MLGTILTPIPNKVKRHIVPYCACVKRSSTPPHLKMAVEKDPKNRWLFSREELTNSPSRADGVDPDKELSYRQQAANMIHDMGQRLQVYGFLIKGRLRLLYLGVNMRWHQVHQHLTFLGASGGGGGGGGGGERRRESGN